MFLIVRHFPDEMQLAAKHIEMSEQNFALVERRVVFSMCEGSSAEVVVQRNRAPVIFVTF